jgi:hypothetical protein
MKKFSLLGFCALAMATSASAQVTLDDFEAGVTASQWTIGGFGNAAAAYNTSGAAGTNNAMQLQDNGFSYSATKTYTAAAPSAGNYKITFFYQNGHTGVPMTGLKVQVNDVQQLAIANGTVTNWTAVETDVFTLAAGADVKLAIVAANGAANTYMMLVDQIVLVPVAVLPIQNGVKPLTNSWLAGSVNLTVSPVGGSGTYSSVAFDIGNNGSIEHTDSTSGDGFTYTWDTTTVADGPALVRVVTTDNNALSGERVVSYTVDNANGRATLFTSDFESWTAGVPNGWTRVDYDAGTSTTPSFTSAAPVAVITEETANAFAGAKSLHINYPASPDPHRYTLLSTPFAANRSNYQVSFAYRGGSFTRLAYFQTYNGSSWYTTSRLFDPGATAVWAEKVDTAYNLGIADPALLPQSLALATHFFGVGDYYADNVNVTASVTQITLPSSVSDWELFQ